jgi:hypothetical protein
MSGARNTLPFARLQALAARIHLLGPGPLAHLLTELANGAEPLSRFEAYARLAPLADFIAEWGGDQIPGLRVLNGGRQ